GREAGRLEKVMLQKGARGLDALRHAADQAGVPVQYVPAGRLDRIAPGLTHQGVVAMAAPITYQDLDAMLGAIAPTYDAVQQRKPLLLALDRIEDPHNFGALLRSAVAAGADGVLVPARHMAPLSATTVKASAGTASRIPIARVDNLAEALLRLKERGYWVAGAAGDGETTVWDMDWDRPLALVMGSEGTGLRPRVAGVCDVRVAIPLRGHAESLNVSVAGGILLFAAARTREALNDREDDAGASSS
ncbi:MAG: 23S rRNA (guanosine(2251)-2'-O)-methyltransferase RlmB, partial [Rhodothermales bacterium]|nr:23S rRNA (guanosine(2251)-2'-O)-methyltransferase RlmB [Rhodothermales bacterium]